MMSASQRSLTVYFAHDDYIEDLKTELERKKLKIVLNTKNFFLVDDLYQPCVWAQQVWKNCEIEEITSIKDAATKLRKKSKIWMPVSLDHHRRTVLICENFKSLKPRSVEYNGRIQNTLSPSFLLLEPNKMISSLDVFPSFSEGKIQFNETKEAPSRAYLKLWESFTLHTKAPQTGQTCVDLGSCPGGWTWVLAKLGCNVWSVDKAPLDPKVDQLPNVHYIKKDAFSLRPKQALELFGLQEPLDWLFSDIICEPQRLYELVQEWRTEKAAKNFLCTIKFKGNTDFEALDRFLKIPNSRAFHLNHNKHEVTWLLLDNS